MLKEKEMVIVNEEKRLLNECISGVKELKPMLYNLADNKSKAI